MGKENLYTKKNEKQERREKWKVELKRRQKKSFKKMKNVLPSDLTKNCDVNPKRNFPELGKSELSMKSKSYSSASSTKKTSQQIASKTHQQSPQKKSPETTSGVGFIKIVPSSKKSNITYIDLTDDGDTSYEQTHKEAKTSSSENRFQNVNYSIQTAPSSNAASGSSVPSVQQISGNTVQRNSRKTISGRNASKKLPSEKCNISCVYSNIPDCVPKDNEPFCEKEKTSYEPVPKKAKFNPKDFCSHHNASMECVASAKNNAASASSVSSKKQISSKITSKNHLRTAQQKSSNTTHGSSNVKNPPSCKKCNISLIDSNLPDCDRENNEQICKKKNTSSCEPIGCSSVASMTTTLSGRRASTSSASSVKRNTRKFTSTFYLSTAQKKSSNTINGDGVEKSQETEANQDGTLTDAIVKSPAEIIAEITHVPSDIINKVIQLLKNDCTVPFIARYRKEVTGDLSGQKIREIKTAYESIKAVHEHIHKILRRADSSQMSSSVINDLMNATTIEEVKALSAPVGTGSIRTLAKKAKSIGLLSVAEEILHARKTLSEAKLQTFVDPATPAIASLEEVKKGIQHIIADTIAKDNEISEFFRNQLDKRCIEISSTKTDASVKKDEQAIVEEMPTNPFKLETYFNFSSTVGTIRGHEVLALNRGESLKILTIKTNCPSSIKWNVFEACHRKFVNTTDEETMNFLYLCIEDSIKRLIKPAILRQIRSHLTKRATGEAIGVFCSNLEHLLLAPPMKGEPLIGIHPGFSHGCKMAVISPTGELMESCIAYPNRVRNEEMELDADVKIMKLVANHNVKTIVIGNGAACRETEVWLSTLIRLGNFSPIDVKYCIVTESGSSEYSVSDEAEKELPGVDPNIRIAVCIARRLQDPLLEFIKVDPKHLGIGMYQHDVPDAMLRTALSSVMVECASFVGVDVNVCPEPVLTKVSGLSKSVAKKIIEWREENGGFVNRKQLREVKGLGPKTFEQCAGFIRISPKTARAVKFFSQTNITNKRTDVKFNPLDTTVIHPESYALAERFLKELNASVDEIGQPSLQAKVIDYFKTSCIESISAQFCATPYAIVTIVDAFKRLQEYDIRSEFEKPLFKSSVMSFSDVKVNAVLTGRVRNVTSFGAFVDIGVGTDGLIQDYYINGHKVLLGDRVSVIVQKVDIPRKRIWLSLVSAPAHPELYLY